jgi:hypothetical protein
MRHHPCLRAEGTDIDYSKSSKGGTRVFDPLKTRTLMTGMGQTVKSNRYTGSNRVADVLERVPEERKGSISDPAFAAAHAQGVGVKDPGLGGVPLPTPQSKWPLEAGSQQAHAAPGESPSSKKPGPRRLQQPGKAVFGRL